MWQFGARSEKRLEGVHPDLVRVVRRALQLSKNDLTIGEGVRTLAQQQEYYRTGKTQTMNSRHLTGHAVDIWPLVDGAVSWDWKYYYPLAECMKQAAKELNVPIEWGGDWKTFKDGPHFQLPWKEYP
ncbi:putative endolysin [Serratia phage Scapp]|uniref:Putative endolysin n=1 Tax=Serratia phage Scapp TaxID=2282409 RepID=A0A345L6P3_9CAUD|nr:endolysin [Serratia phage Scapp]AXH50945.1 putative endolysin [Serratia phage Scapp]